MFIADFEFKNFALRPNKKDNERGKISLFICKQDFCVMNLETK